MSDGGRGAGGMIGFTPASCDAESAAEGPAVGCAQKGSEESIAAAGPAITRVQGARRLASFTAPTGRLVGCARDAIRWKLLIRRHEAGLNPLRLGGETAADNRGGAKGIAAVANRKAGVLNHGSQFQRGLGH